VTLAGLPTGTIPEIAIIKKSDQHALSKLALFAYDRTSGGVVWISGTSSGFANSKNLFIGGMGPIQTGSHKKTPEFMGVVLPQMTVQAVPIPILPWEEPEKEAAAPKRAEPAGPRDGAIFQPKELGVQEPPVVPIPIPLPAPGGSPFTSRIFHGFAARDESLIQSDNSDKADKSAGSAESDKGKSVSP
jgi:hypothetical protein